MAKKATVSKDEHGEPVRARVEVKHEFSAEELREIGSEAARLYQSIAEKELAKKAATSVVNSAIKEMQSKLGELMNKQTNGYETRTVDALVEFRRKQGKKRLLWNTPGKPGHRTLIREEAMTEQDYDSLTMDDNPLLDAKVKDENGDAPKPGDPLVKVFANETQAEEVARVVAKDSDGEPVGE